MKKLLALALAASMVSSISITSFANPFASHNIALGDDSDNFLHSELLVEDANGVIVKADEDGAIPYGDTAYFALVGHRLTPSSPGLAKSAVTEEVTSHVTDGQPGEYAQLVYENDAVDGVRVAAEWDTGESLIKGVKIVKKKAAVEGEDTGLTLTDITNSPQSASATGPQSYAYFVAVELEEGTYEDLESVSGTLIFNQERSGKSKLKAAHPSLEDPNTGENYESGDVVHFPQVIELEVDIEFPVTEFDESPSIDIENMTAPQLA